MKSERSVIKLNAYAKINLCLCITGKRQDGYHLLDSIFVPISLHDEITIKKGVSGINLECSGGIPSGESNTAYKAAKLIMDETRIAGVDINIKKAIPSGAGLGGGSSNAAAVFYGMNELFGLDIPAERLNNMGLMVGADVPFFLGNTAARVKGIGEIIEPIVLDKTVELVLIKPPTSLSTPDVYREFDRMGIAGKDCCEEIAGHIQSGDLSGAYKLLCNDLEPAAAKLCPEIKGSVEYLGKAGARATLMTGSGSCVFGIFESGENAKDIADSYSGEGAAFAVSTDTVTVKVEK